MNNFNDICVCCGRYVPEGRQVCSICEENELDNLKNEMQAELLEIKLAIEEANSVLEKQLATAKEIILDFWNCIKAFLFSSKRYKKIIHLSKHGKTARIRKKNRACLIRLFLREKYKPG